MINERRVLLIEDDPTIRHVVTEALIDEGYVVREAGDGRAALVVLESWQPGLIILDLMMPGMGGPEFRAEQRTRGLSDHVPIILLSASRRAQEAVGPLGAVAVVAKPFDLADLMIAIDNVDRPNGGSAPAAPTGG